MGAFPKISCSGHDHGLSKVMIREVPVPNPLNPDPTNFLIERIEYKGMGNFIVVQVKYPNCTNYEGRKILVFHWMTIEQLVNLDVLDPHFSSKKPELSPVARFVPSDEGWDMAIAFARMKSK